MIAINNVIISLKAPISPPGLTNSTAHQKIKEPFIHYNIIFMYVNVLYEKNQSEKNLNFETNFRYNVLRIMNMIINSTINEGRLP